MINPDIDSLLNSNNVRSAAVTLYQLISDLCSQGNDLSPLTEPQKNFFFIQEIERIVNAGHFYDYFYNPSGRFAHEALAALDIIDAELTAGVVAFAISCFPNEQVPKDDEERREQLTQMSKEDKDLLHSLTQTLYSSPENLNILCMEYARENKSAF
ncbi:MAG: DUF4375 domain-containing protein [Chitinophagaceae bacterium]|nr:DUF4375 domain-containing protein [Chitinophagaceae bacterium]